VTRVTFRHEGGEIAVEPARAGVVRVVLTFGEGDATVTLRVALDSGEAAKLAAELAHFAALVTPAVAP
jgi:hypothetical protein